MYDLDLFYEVKQYGAAHLDHWNFEDVRGIRSIHNIVYDLLEDQFCFVFFYYNDFLYCVDIGKAIFQKRWVLSSLIYLKIVLRSTTTTTTNNNNNNNADNDDDGCASVI